jgi:hypothetical protein
MMTVVGGTRVIPEDLGQTFERMTAALKGAEEQGV